jgi:hypothetical protein
MKRLPVVPSAIVLAILTVGMVVCSSTAAAAGQTPSITLNVSAPANGSNFVAGEKPVVTVTLPAGLSTDDLATLNLYLYGPQETTQTVTAVKLLNASTDRAVRPHHYIDLLADPAAVVDGEVLTYTLQAVSDEQPGTYTASLWAVSNIDALDQTMSLVDLQIGTAAAEKQIVDENQCAKCHQGADNGQFYLHHTDPSRPGSSGNPSLDSWPVRTCKSCHNTNGYAAYRDPQDSSVRVPDPIVKRVHGVHMGEFLENPLDTDPDAGIFKDYIDVVFPYGVRGETVAPYEEMAGVRNCTVCHADSRWKTKPSRLACGSCHDNIWFGRPAEMPAGGELHPGGERDDDTGCAFCHPPDIGGLKPVAEAHRVEAHKVNGVDISMTPPANGTYYTAADDATGVVITLTIKGDAGTPIVHTDVTDVLVSAANLYVYGPRDHSKPVLTNTAINGISKLRSAVTNNTAAGGTPPVWTFAPGDRFMLAVNGGAILDLAAPEGANTPDNVVAWLNTAFAAHGINATASKSGTTKVKIESLLQGGESSRIEIYNSAVTTIMGWKPAGVTMEPYVKAGTASTQNVDLRELTSVDPALNYIDPDVARNADNITYLLRGKFADLRAGTYCVYTYFVPKTGKINGFNNPVALALKTFQVGTAAEEPKVATNCTDCHGDSIMHLYESHIHPGPFDTDYCRACHDYAHYGTGDAFVNQGGTSTNGWSGFGAVPIARRVHGVHYGKYLEHSEEIYANADYFKDVIFPQDIRNCTKCHADNPMWKQEPGRVPCLACHDSDAAKFHGALMTYDPTPGDPYGGDEVETCTVCHGEDSTFSPDVVHNISDPYRPPYLREPTRQED